MEAERRRRIPDETMAELDEAGLLRARQPVRFGGLEMPPSEFRAITFELAQRCGSTGWVMSVLAASSSLLASVFSDEAQQQVWGADPDALLCNVLFPGGVAVRDGDGYVMSGRFPYASGCDFASWAMLGARIEGDDIPAGAISWGMLVPMAELRVEDDWQVLGLRATGSKTLVADSVRVPEAHVRAIENPVGTVGPYTFSTVAAGIAKGGIERFRRYAVERGSIVRGWSVDSDAMRTKLAESAAEVDAAWALICRDCAEGEAAMWRGGSALPPEIRARNRRNAAFATRLAVTAMDRLFVSAGGSAGYSSSLVQQSFRDAHTAALHFSMHWDAAAVESGRSLIETGR